MPEHRVPIGTVVSLFTGGMGFDLGFEAEGFEVKVSVEMDSAARRTIIANRPDLPVIGKDIATVSSSEIASAANQDEPLTTLCNTVVCRVASVASPSATNSGFYRSS